MAEERILLIQLRQLGDILLTTPCAAAIRRERPKAKLTFLSHKMGRLVLDDNPHVDEHFSYEDGWGVADHLRFLRTLRERRFDTVIDFMGNPRSALFTLATGARERVAFKSARGPAYTTTIAKSEEPPYVVQRKMRLLAAAGFKPPPLTDFGAPFPERGSLTLVQPWNEGHMRPMMQLLGTVAEAREAKLRVVLSPTHRREPRRWPLAKYAALADRLVSEWGAAVIWLWGPGEEGDVDAAMRLCTQRTIKAPKTSFREMAAMLANCDLFIGNSNGPSHVAVAVGIPSLQLHGPTDGAAWCPPANERHHWVQAPEVVGSDGKKVASLDALTVDTVWGALDGMRPVVDDQAQKMRQRGPRFQWRGGWG